MSAEVPLGLEWTRPIGLLALALPIAVLLASRLFERPVEIATGTLAIWQRVRAARPSPSQRARRRIPPALWLLAAALALGALALAGPRRPSKTERTIRVLVDSSPSMQLPLGSGTRGARAEAMAREWIERNASRARVEWIAGRGTLGPEDDRPDTLWVTDAAPKPRPERAGFVASGGSAVPGPIAVDGSTRYDWDGERIVEVPGGAPKRRIVVTGELPEPIAGVLAAWSEARGTIVSAGAGPGASLVIRTKELGSRRELEVGRDGWRARVVAEGTPAVFSTWLEDAEHRALVAFAPGEIESTIASMGDPGGDPAAFAVSWGKLFDEAVLAPPGVVELGGRLAAGEEAIVPPRIDGIEPIERGSFLLQAWLAASAVGCAIFALGLAGRFRFVR